MQNTVSSGGLNPKQTEEIKFWSELYGRFPSYLDYVRMRMGEYERDTKRFPNFEAQRGPGIDLGCGLVSILEGGPTLWRGCFAAIDPLMEEFRNLMPQLARRVYYWSGDGERLTELTGVGTLDWIFCVNALDHTPNPGKMIVEMRRALAPGGKLYFGVNFDQELYQKAHFTLFNRKLVHEAFAKGAWKIQSEDIEDPKPEDYPYVPEEALATRERYWAELEKV